jgi:hypothetical protein
MVTALRHLHDEPSTDFSRAVQSSKIVRDWTLLAYITREEERIFDDKSRHGGISLRKCMPAGWCGTDCFARYCSYGIDLMPIQALAAATT